MYFWILWSCSYICFIMKLNNARSDLTDISAENASLKATQETYVTCNHVDICKNVTRTNASNKHWCLMLGTSKLLVIQCDCIYCMTSEHANAFQHSEPCRVTMWYPMRDLKEALQLPCSREHEDIISAYTVVMDLASHHWLRTWLFEFKAFVR